MRSLTLDLPDDLNRFIETKASAAGFADPGEFVRQVLRAFWKENAKAELEGKLITALESGPAVEATPEFWANLRDRIRNGEKAPIS